MNIEEKAQAYDEMVQRVKELHEAGNALTKKQMEIVLPELAESEDERVRKWIYNVIDSLGMPADEDAEKELEEMQPLALAYLKKQKEPAPVPDKFSGLKSIMLQYLQSAANRKDDAEIEDDTDLYGRKILDYIWKYEEKQEEQKPVEIHIDNPNIEKFDPDVKVTTSDSSAGGAVNVADKAGLKDAEQKPAEWSEEDEKMRQHIVSDLREFRDCETDEGLISDYENEIAWLKSLRPSWKPSEEQIRALNEIICLGEISYVGQEEELIALRNKLKKLM